MKKINDYTINEFTYESKTVRNHHVAEMEQEGWEESGQVKRLKDHVSIMDATDKDYEWFARFRKANK
jgi:hypothetical protein